MANTGEGAGGKCPNCGGGAASRYRPFCSKRCADLDLARWLNGSYAVPVVELDERDLDELERFVEGGELESDDPDESESENPDNSSGYGY